MKHGWPWPVPILLLLALLACGPSQSALQTAIAQTQVIAATVTSRAAQTLTAAAPAPTGTQLTIKTPVILDTPSPTGTSAPSRTPRPTGTPKPEVSATPSDTPTPLATATRTPAPTRRPVAGPNFLDVVVAVKKQVENFGGQIDIAVGSGNLDCQQTVDSYEYVAARATINNVPNSDSAAYGLYVQGVNIFLTKSADLYTNCKNFLANPNGSGGIPPLQWTVARTSVNDADQLLRQAIIAAGGTP